jgi:hypothetical protein
MLENKVSLLLTSSDFNGLLWLEAFLADLHLVRTITARHSITTLPPPSVLHASIFASRNSGEAVSEFLSSKKKDESDR